MRAKNYSGVFSKCASYSEFYTTHHIQHAASLLALEVYHYRQNEDDKSIEMII